MDIDALTHPTDTRAAAKALAEAATTAGYAPSIHNTQPWRWRLTGNTLDLHLVRGRIQQASDPDGRLATLSCGAALHHARITMAAHGWRITVTRMLQGADRDLLARLHVDHRSPADPAAAMLLGAIPSRHTDRRAVADTPLDPGALTAVTAAVEAQGTRLHTLRPDQLLDLATAADHAQHSQTADPAWQAELIYWTGLARPGRSVVPAGAGHDGSLPVTARHDRAAVFVMLYGSGDEPLDWLRAGEALSAGWLTATGRGVSVLPHSAPIETIATREALHAMIAGGGHPYLVLRLGTADPADAGRSHQPADQIIERY
jgi:nitroreductase